ncbi:uncharacterized protein LOC110739382 isoform X1 [Chenopodium quinoa]|uniref:uncharacterized protein LOC110739382 isoform X1 n=1 Tax=Chenopodium quinoa TaxID=63459 RepID=UPI000B792090|nr:uncharacterized protein LOC110739382 isoform X1 [Chenopodium quinoa]XP_021775531.1 uncharacterized protein LOC110739382 isoform X1 [Chenopodium quinoa]XP_021775532.1 uncharacterized protein LOC110739382 isoform X1 [Chenopodium quinoa]
MPKSMLRAVDPDDKASVRGVDTLDLDGILGNLCEAMLRVQGLRQPLKDKSKEVTAAKARVDSALDRAQFDIAQNELLTLDMMYSQAEANMQVKKDLDSARLHITSLKQEITSLKEKLEPLQDAKEEAERAKQRVGRLEQRLTNQEHQLKTKFESVAEKGREALVKQMMSDYDAIMRDTWAAVQPDSDYQTWKSKFDEASKAFDARLLDEAENEARAAAEAEESSGSDSSGESSSGGEEEDQVEEREKNDEEQPKGNRPAANEETLP